MFDWEGREFHTLQAARIDSSHAISRGIHAFPEWMNAALGAEMVLDRARSEGVRGEVLFRR